MADARPKNCEPAEPLLGTTTVSDHADGPTSANEYGATDHSPADQSETIQIRIEDIDGSPDSGAAEGFSLPAEDFPPSEASPPPPPPAGGPPPPVTLMPPPEIGPIFDAIPAGKVLSWSDVCFTVAADASAGPDTPGRKKILDNCWGSVYGGEVCALLGPSGAGKTTLLNLLSGRQRWGRGNAGAGPRATGCVQYNGQTVTINALKKAVAFVQQEESLSPMQTVFESLLFSARLQLADASEEECHKRVEELIELLKLEKCRDTYVGNKLLKGLSGGEKKRTAVGMELISEPDIIFLDEPTSGLDSFAARTLIQQLRVVATERSSIYAVTK